MLRKLLILILFMASVTACSSATPTPTPTRFPTLPPTEIGDLKLTILYDNIAGDSRLKPDWGFAALVEYGGHTLLFDTGANGSILLDNMRQLSVDPPIHRGSHSLPRGLRSHWRLAGIAGHGRPAHSLRAIDIGGSLKQQVSSQTKSGRGHRCS